MGHGAIMGHERMIYYGARSGIMGWCIMHTTTGLDAIFSSRAAATGDGYYEQQPHDLPT